MRMFVAVVPPAEVLDDLVAFLEPRRQADPALRWTESYQWHLTLAFLPEVGLRNLDDLVARLTRAAARRRTFTVTVAGSGAFPAPERARVLWLGATADPVESLARLATGVRAAANKAGATVEGGRFRAHLTLARLRRPQDATRWLRILDSYQAGRWPATSIELIESHLGQGPAGHPRYETVAVLPLGRAED
ncbi:MAG: 2,3-cyclic 3-phosphodiesterase, partial [Nocardioidaceae bacterium]|nr:2,3-cyclic 3-phosphodiesterase [Nocardioidaceae bacterium]